MTTLNWEYRTECFKHASKRFTIYRIINLSYMCCYINLIYIHNRLCCNDYEHTAYWVGRLFIRFPVWLQCGNTGLRSHPSQL